MGCTVSLNSNQSDSSLGDKTKGRTNQPDTSNTPVSANTPDKVNLPDAAKLSDTSKLPNEADLPDRASLPNTSDTINPPDTASNISSIKSVTAIEPAVDASSAMASQSTNNNNLPKESSPPMDILLPELTRNKRGYLKPRETFDDTAPSGYLTVHEMYNMVNSGYSMPYILDPRYILILDARDQSEFIPSHILTARHHTAIDSDYDCILEAGKLDQYNFIVLYDGDSKPGQLSGTLVKLCERIKERHDPYILDGGIEEFKKVYPFLCTDRMIFTEKERYQEIQSYPSNILYGVLFQGNGQQATSKKVIEDLGITHIVNITVEHDNQFSDMVDYLHLKFTDEVQSHLEHRLSSAADYIADAIRDGGRVFVHCVQGISRSSTITLSFLMKYQAWTVQDAYHFLKDKRSAAQPNRGFFVQLGNFERDLFGERISDVEQLWIG